MNERFLFRHIPFRNSNEISIIVLTHRVCAYNRPSATNVFSKMSQDLRSIRYRTFKITFVF